MFSSILVPVDLAAGAGWQRQVTVAAELARPSNAKLHALVVVPDFGMSIVGSYFDQSFEQKAMAEAKTRIDDFARSELPSDIQGEGHVAHGAIYDEILGAADKIGCDAIVLAAHRPGFKDYLLGSNAARVVRHAKQSVIVVRD
ncbi:MAG: universal stress protein [Neomegalonema sp.]|nr:universal stress protein [Neomegalonema sp.]